MSAPAEPPFRRHLLPVLGGHSGGSRSAMTCRYRCGDACAHPAPNPSDNDYVGDVIATAMSRRGLLQAGALTALVVAAPPFLRPGPAAAAGSTPTLSFDPVPPNTVDAVVVPNGYDHAVVVRWGDPVEAGAPAFEFDDQTPAAQAQQFGYNNDFLALMPLPGTTSRALLVVNHEYTDENLMFRGWEGAATAPKWQLQVAMMAHGLSVVEIERVGRSGQWRLARGDTPHNRRVTMDTLMRLTGPAAGHPLLRTPGDPNGRTVRGTLNNCAGGHTPWGTTLHGEENFNGYFANPDAAPAAQKVAFERYGIGTRPTDPFYRGWERVESRFDIAESPNEANRYGWVVELDPYTPGSVPRKRTALGRLKHEGATTAVTADGRVAVYMGDDERFEYLYKFVSREKLRADDRRHNLKLLDEGDLFVARLSGDSPPAEIDGTGSLPADGRFDGGGFWIPLVKDGTSRVPGMNVAQVLIHTRFAADAVGATKMDRPEDVERNPVTGAVYAVFTNNSRRTEPGQQDEANPLLQATIVGDEGRTVAPGNRNGHIIELRERSDDAGATVFGWSIFLVAGLPDAPETYFAGFDKSQVSPISCPDNVAFDPDGNLWIATDGNVLGSNDGLFAVPVRGPDRGHLRQFLTVPVGAETCGPLVTPDQRTVFVSVQHPGEVDGATTEDRASSWPDGGQPRPAVVCAWRTASGSKRIGA